MSYSFFAILSDIHANIDALDAVFEDMAHFPVRGIFCLGDIIGYGPEPAVCLEKMQSEAMVTVIGNHEIMTLYRRESDEPLPPPLEKSCLHTIKQLSEEQFQWISNLPIAADISPLTLSHGSLNEPGEFFYVDSDEEAEAHFAAQSTFISFHGHSHVPVVWEESEVGIQAYAPSERPVRLNASQRYAVNVGSVGQPRDGDPRACYVLYDLEQRIVLHRRVEYDIPKAQARFRKAKLSAFLARRIAKGE